MTYPSPDHHIDTHHSEYYPSATGSDYETRDQRLARKANEREQEERIERFRIEMYGERYWENPRYNKEHANYKF